MSSVIADAGFSRGVTGVPAFRFVTNITNQLQAVVTTSEDHTYTIGEVVSFRTSKPYGMVEINNRSGKILSVTANTLTVDIETTNFTPFINAGENFQFPALVVPSCSSVIPGSNPATINLLDAFTMVKT